MKKFQVEVILKEAERNGKIFIKEYSPGTFHVFEIVLSDEPKRAAVEVLNWEERIKENAIRFKYKEIK